MTTISLTLTDGSDYEFDVEHLTAEQVFAAVKVGLMTFEQFDEWRSAVYSSGYSDGSFNQSFYGN